ncbi:aspartic protease Sxa1 [Schizosaccharomyces cryophilus OY26]|uniref:Aspartic protease Sxa1 n=1 Tax=Schizosaccharomyces cryophilus (strain OY26 / ATCC MYA-4695 / CBS 11777 / NBRC 106824 / NRRL Y48691) TaxID=653667 RepID=S9XE45_SCHCR|nr:aspartic protease Sxa1 [Schizosaccharomyces cryophilus OY26]EPY52051.1 aspartic protease Sxa1 [Schizosaccharomyces cryophilus OY26]
MKLSFFWAAACVLQAAKNQLSSAAIVDMDGSPGKSVVLGLQHSYAQDDSTNFERARVLNKREDSGYPLLDLEYTSSGSYFASIIMGHKKRNYSLTLDTGSPYTWVTANNVTALDPSEFQNGMPAGKSTSDIREICSNYTCYDFSDGSAKLTSNSVFGFLTSYGDNTTAIGYNMVDTAYFAGLSLDNFTFGVATREYDSEQISVTPGIIGLSPGMTITGVSRNGRAVAYTPPTIVEQLYTSGLINSYSFGIYLNENEGELIFGGYNEARIDGDVRWLNVTGTDRFYSVYLESLSFPNSSSTQDSSKLSFEKRDTGNIQVDQNATVDTGTVLLYLPEDAVNSIADRYDGVVSNQGYPVVYCSSFSDSDYVQFNFENDVAFQIPMKQLVILRRPEQGQEVCYLAFVPSAPGSYILGQYFLQNVYSVYDWDARRIGFANLRQNASNSGVEVMNIASDLSGVQTSSNSATTTFSDGYNYGSSTIPLTGTPGANSSAPSQDSSSNGSNESVASASSKVGIYSLLAFMSSSFLFFVFI